MPQPYRILHVIDHLGPGGAQEALLNLVQYADRRRFHLEVATLHGRGVYWDLLGQCGVPRHSLSPHKFVPLYLVNLLRLLGRGRFDLVHCHLIGANLLAKPLAALFGRPVLFNHDQCHDIFRHQHKIRLALDRLANLFTDHIIAVSDSTRKFLLEMEKIPYKKVALIYNSVDLARFFPDSPGPQRQYREKYGLPAEGPLVLGVGRLAPQKNFPGFLRVAAALSRRRPEVCFAIAGAGPDRLSLESLARQLGLAHRVHFLGYVSDMRELYWAGDVLFFPSLYEGTPMAVLEAMACGLPVVASQVDGAAEILTDGHDALLAPPEQLQALEQRLDEVLRDPGLARRLAHKALIKVRDHFAAPVMAHKVENLYLQHLEARSNQSQPTCT